MLAFVDFSRGESFIAVIAPPPHNSRRSFFIRDDSPNTNLNTAKQTYLSHHCLLPKRPTVLAPATSYILRPRVPPSLDLPPSPPSCSLTCICCACNRFLTPSVQPPCIPTFDISRSRPALSQPYLLHASPNNQAVIVHPLRQFPRLPSLGAQPSWPKLLSAQRLLTGALVISHPALPRPPFLDTTA